MPAINRQSAAEMLTEERCHIREIINSDDDPAVSIARARVEPGVTTAWHAVLNTVERFIILQGSGAVFIGDAPAEAVNAGDTVQFQNISSFVHTVSTSPDTTRERQETRLPAGAAAFDSGEIAPGATWNHTFTTPGTYQYFCEPHLSTGMVGTVIVRP